MKHDLTETLALHGGPRAKRTPFATGRRHGAADKRLLAEVVDSDVLFYFLGTKVFEFQKQFAAMYGMRHCIACSSGTASVHIALGALGLPAGSEVITTPITDMGSLTGMLYQGLVPVFADVDPDTLNMDPASVRRALTPRTRAILAVHHSGLAADMDPLIEIAREHKLRLVEDCAQAYECFYKGRRAGTMGEISCFSLNHFKHISAGSGGMVLTNDDALRYRASLFLDKCYQREEGIRNPFFLAPNYQMTELQGAVALAQIQRVQDVVALRNHLGQRLNAILRDVPGITLQRTEPDSRHAFFLYLFRLELNQLSCTATEFADALKGEGVPGAAHLITGGRPVYLYDLFQHRSALPGTEWPLIPERQYNAGDCPTAEDAFHRWITLHIYEYYTEQDIDELGFAIAKVAHYFRSR